jgi:hypothetical protein
MNTSTIIDSLVVLIFIGWVLVFPLQKSRVRARWAKAAFIIAGLLGIAMGVLNVLLDIHWFDRSYVHTVHVVLRFIDGLLLGFIFSLILSGQFRGTKRDENHVA